MRYVSKDIVPINVSTLELNLDKIWDISNVVGIVMKKYIVNNIDQWMLMLFKYIASAINSTFKI